MINHAMFQRNGRAGYVLKPLALRSNDKQLLSKRTEHFLDIKVSTSGHAYTAYTNPFLMQYFLLLGHLRSTTPASQGFPRPRNHRQEHHRPLRRNFHPHPRLDSLSFPPQRPLQREQNLFRTHRCHRCERYLRSYHHRQVRCGEEQRVQPGLGTRPQFTLRLRRRYARLDLCENRC